MLSYYLVGAFKRLDADQSGADDEMVGLEWTYFNALQHSEGPARTLDRALSRRRLSLRIYLASNASDAQANRRRLRARRDAAGSGGRAEGLDLSCGYTESSQRSPLVNGLYGASARAPTNKGHFRH